MERKYKEMDYGKDEKKTENKHKKKPAPQILQIHCINVNNETQIFRGCNVCVIIHQIFDM